MEDSPGLQVRDRLFYSPADFVEGGVELFFPVEEFAMRWFSDGNDHAETEVADPVVGLIPSRTPEPRNAALSWRQPSAGSEGQRSRPVRSQTTWRFTPVVWCLPEYNSG